MTRKISISLPDELADEVQASGNASAYIAAALREQHRIHGDLAIMDDLWGPAWQGDITDDDRARAARLHAGSAQAADAA
ncbi:ribbon-helix-helix domain-containing protein [Planotetraspora sp. A-T 1434]|uniref:ribbon-helix-helix domain-containing protein n=1 Tax=Planotetraspora sp. A-T 1434 TaxID=2979219 RepID=UPI0021C21CD2|nr:ribbon-helix-helix domain-containing protein [Planotetraspora sp. A-T 1434]MCT9934811.1 ribbon-helix-helix domain-containing protein [Planotetraspora sp. A-T 1434]